MKKKQNKLNEAIRDFTKALEINPKYTDVYYNRALAYSDSKMYNEAIQDNKNIACYMIEKDAMWGMGTPEELTHYLENFK